MKIDYIIRISAAAACSILLCGCEEEEYQLRFSHYMHVEDIGMECSDCHGEPGVFQSISHDSCIDCHEEPEAKQITTETCGMCHVQERLYRLKLLETDVEDADEETPAAVSVFVHTESLEGRCAECHESLMDEEMEIMSRMQRSDILAIREASHGSGQDCTTCHVELSPSFSPASHDRAWTKRHGMMAMQDEASCTICHTEDSCTDCHSVIQPASHNNVFRMQTHGAVAAWDRNSCQVCHTEDSCTSCHADTRPRSHNARWGAPGYRPTHCIGCHDTSSPGDGCVTCHEEGNDVMLHERYWGGAPIDHSLLTTESCYICHWTQTP